MPDLLPYFGAICSVGDMRLTKFVTQLGAANAITNVMMMEMNQARIPYPIAGTALVRSITVVRTCSSSRRISAFAPIRADSKMSGVASTMVACPYCSRIRSARPRYASLSDLVGSRRSRGTSCPLRVRSRMLDLNRL